MLWAVVSAVAAFLTPGTHVFIVHTVFSVFSDCLCFQNKLMMMMMNTFRAILLAKAIKASYPDTTGA